MAGTKEKIIARSELSDKTINYLLVVGILLAAVTVVGIPLLPFLFLFFWFWYRPRYPQFHSMVLTEKSLEVRSGVIFRRETSIPLERITDATVSQGPVMRYFGIHGITIETAGQTLTSGSGSLPGIIEPYEFRKKILAQRDLLAGKVVVPETPPEVSEGSHKLLEDIRDILVRIEKQNAGGATKGATQKSKSSSAK